MLSKVLSGHGRENIKPATFAPANTRYSQAPAKDAPSAAEGELKALRERVRQLEAELAAAKRESFDSGHRQGEQQARAEIGPVIERMNGSIAELTGFRGEMRYRAEKDVVQLALLIARRILHRELSVDPNALTALARVIFERLARAESYQVTVHPSFVPAVTAALPAAQAARAALPAAQAARVRIEADPRCAVGTLIIRSDEGLVDASIDSQLEEISRGLTDRLAQAGTHQ
jgi:flagellar assembly protein FliH